MTTRSRRPVEGGQDSGGGLPSATPRTALVLLVGALAGVGGGWLTVQAGQPWAAGVLAGAGFAVTATRIAAEVIRERPADTSTPVPAHVAPGRAYAAGVGDRGEPRWQPISRLPELTAHIEQGVRLAAEQLATLAGAREQPYVLDDMTVARVIATFTRTRTDLVTLFAEQGRRWQGLDLGASRRRDVDRFVDLVAAELDLVEQILALAEELKAATIERMLAKSDLQIGLEAFTRHGR